MTTIDDSMRETFARTGHWHLRGFLDVGQQDAFVREARALAVRAPFLHPRMRDGRPMSVKVSSFGDRGWWADEQGYRYIERHPSGEPFPAIPDVIGRAMFDALAATIAADHSAVAAAAVTAAYEADTCLVNLYEPGAQLGWHVDRTERDLRSPIVTFSIGATCTFMLRMEDQGETRTFRYTLRSGDAIVMAGPSRMAEHTVTDIRTDQQGSLFDGNHNPLASKPGLRLSFTVRRTGWA